MNGWLTPDSIPSSYIYRVIVIPNDIGIISAVNGALVELTYPYRWELFGSVSVADITDEMMQLFYRYITSNYPMIGAIIPLAIETLPDNVLPCDGSTFDAIDYPDLFAVLDPVFKSVSTFVTPDLRGKTVIGTSGAYAVNDSGGATTHTLSVNEIPIHSHSEVTSVATIINGGLEAPASSALPSIGTTGTAGLGQSHNNMQPYVALKYGIIAK